MLLIKMSNGSTELMQRPLIGLTLDGLRAVAAECGLPRFAAGQMAKWIYDKRVKIGRAHV